MGAKLKTFIAVLLAALMIIPVIISFILTGISENVSAAEKIITVYLDEILIINK